MGEATPHTSWRDSKSQLITSIINESVSWLKAIPNTHLPFWKSGKNMAFVGIEVKSGKPFTHKYDDSKERLHISIANLFFILVSISICSNSTTLVLFLFFLFQPTLVLGRVTIRSMLQYNVGNRDQ
ncbi:hypothetical protein PIB30_051050 [Stylosanthes scabra]|uniref:Uncharacterized protein n=1 Tax=Stylosanthes scabra TaxID=79078 RepID=A0ABU6RI52_9FABA|nr:hypothetical protein [Stylosanthes scabra]